MASRSLVFQLQQVTLQVQAMLPTHPDSNDSQEGLPHQANPNHSQHQKARKNKLTTILWFIGQKNTQRKTKVMQIGEFYVKKHSFLVSTSSVHQGCLLQPVHQPP